MITNCCGKEIEHDYAGDVWECPRCGVTRFSNPVQPVPAGPVPVLPVGGGSSAFYRCRVHHQGDYCRGAAGHTGLHAGQHTIFTSDGKSAPRIAVATMKSYRRMMRRARQLYLAMEGELGYHRYKQVVQFLRSKGAIQ